MALKQITELEAAVAPAGTDVVLVDEAGVSSGITSRKLALSAIPVTATQVDIIGATPATPSLADAFLFADADDSDAVKGATLSALSALLGGSGPANYAIRRITNADSPYLALAADEVLFCDTSAGAITVTLPPGIAGRRYKVVNVGTFGGPNVQLDPDAGDELWQNGAGVGTVIAVGETYDFHFETVIGWYA